MLQHEKRGFASEKTTEAWSARIGYHFSTEKYIELSAWFGSYAAQVEKEKTTRS